MNENKNRNKTFRLRLLGAVLIIVGVSLFGFIQYRNSGKDDVPLVFAPKTLLSGLWEDYKKVYWEADSGRTVDRQRDDITTSEGQSYTMLRAVWQSDKETFDKTWEWTKTTIQRKDDKLFSWKWGQLPDGSYGVLTDQGGQNTASDGDVDIALSLVMAASRWQQQDYLDDAQAIIKDIWDKEVIIVNDKPYLASNNLEKQSMTDAVMNPSYFAPYAFRLFAKVDPDHPWDQLVDSSYELLNQSMDEQLDKAKSAGLPPDWFLMNKTTGAIRAAEGDLTTNYGFDAMRTPWRLALDYQWNNEPRAKATLEKMRFLSDEWDKQTKIYSTYAHDGAALNSDEVAAIYGGNIGYFSVADPELATAVYEQKLKSLYDPNTQTWSSGMTYYSDNWAWFGIGLYNRLLDNPVKDR